MTRKKPSVDLVLRCLLDKREERMMARDAFLPRAPLIAHPLMQVEDGSTARSPSLLTGTLRIEERIANYLLGSDEIDPRLDRFVRLASPTIGLEGMVLPEKLRTHLVQVAHSLHNAVPKVIYVQGASGVGKKTTVEALCHSSNLRAVMVDVAGLLSGDLSPEVGAALAFREAKLQGAVLCWAQFDQLFSDDKVAGPCLANVIGEINKCSRTVFATGEAAWQPGSALVHKPLIHLDIGLPTHAARRELWETCLNGFGPKASEKDVDEVADKFQFTPAQIKDAAATAQNSAMCDGGSEVSTYDLYAACRIMSNQRLSLLARKIQPKYEWDDIVLPRDQKAQLREIANYVKYRHIVFADWNFEQKISLGKGLNVLFAGPSGTGKTMASEIIASELGLDLYKIDLSTVISKYIGETEKNLDRIFNEAQYSNSILFFDEADAVFGKRSEVRDSHDRYANIEVAYLLQKMEEYDGIVILATNLRKNLDEAFARRMHFSIEFPQPEEPDRLLIWKGVFPKEAPVSEHLDLHFLARQFKVTGGNIKNIALGAAFLAADDGGAIKMEHLIRATKREFQKIGRLCTETDFGNYYELVKG